MQNTHSHAWIDEVHFEPATIKEADLSRGRRLDLSVKFEEYMKDAAPFEACIVFGLKGRLTGYWVPDQHVADFVAKAPDKLVGFASCDPTQPGHMDELRFAIEELRLKGLKMGPIYGGFDPRDPLCEPVYRYCEENNLPIVFHAGTTFNRAAPLAYCRPWIFDEVAIKHPELRMVLAHIGHPFVEECLVVIRKHPHLYSDIAALYYRPWQFYNALVAAQEYKVGQKILFGTDYPFTTAADSIAGLRNVNAVAGTSGLPRVTEETIEGILSRDSLSLLGIGR